MPGRRLRPIRAVALVTLVALPFASSGAPASAKPEEAISLSRATVPAAGRQTAVARTTRFGRYAISASSPGGTALYLNDRMSGPGETHGEPGHTNGRVDAFLDRGETQVVLLSDDAGTGDARLEAHPFVEKNGPRPPLLPEQTQLSTTLADLEQRSWWVRLPAATDFAVELAGRSLADVRLWRDGQWLDPATPSCEPLDADPKRPLNACVVATHLDPGLYQLVAYGGPAVAWSVNESAQPLHVRYGIPALSVAGRIAGEIGPFGTERWIGQADTTLFRLEVPQGDEAGISVRPYDRAQPLRRDGTVDRVVKESVPPVAQVTMPKGKALRVVTVSGHSGQPFVLQQLPEGGRSIPVQGDGTYLLTTLHAGHPADRVDVTGVLAEAKAGAEALVTQLVPLAPDQPWRRKFNLLGTTSVFFDVREGGTFQVATAAPTTRWRMEPLLVTTPKGYTPPAFKEGTGTVDLAPGRWRLTLEPGQAGVAEVVVRRDAAQKVEPSPVRPNVQIPAVVLEKDKRYTLTLNQDSGQVGLVLRKLPADLGESLPLTLGPGDSLAVPVTVPSAGAISAGRGLDVSVDGGPFAASVEGSAGGHTIAVRNAGAGVIEGALGLAHPDKLRGALPELPDTEQAAPDLPVLAAGKPRFLDLAALGTSTYRLQVEKAGLYRVESMGLLATAGAVRTRTNPSLASGVTNGVGRNFLVQTYLRDGEYQVTVGAQGASAGHLGVALTNTAMVDGGLLRDGVPARASVPAGAGVAYRFDAVDAGDYQLRAFGMGRLFRVRVEDADGWPLLAPDVAGDVKLRLPKGAGRIIVLPEPGDTTRITTLTRVPEPVKRAGHGPHALALDTAVKHVWWESAKGEPRAPDQWTFEATAPADFTVSVDADMAGELFRAGQPDPLARLVPGRDWEGRLEAGKYRLELTNVRRNSGAEYTLRVTTRELVPGLTRQVALPAVVPVSVGKAGLVELASMGMVDVRARLFDATGREVVRSDDRPDDWNFRVAERLAPGAYTLRVDAVGVASGTTAVSMALATEADLPYMQVGDSREMPLTGASLVPLQVPGEGLLVVSARSTENIGLAMEASAGSTWRTLARQVGPTDRIAVRLAKDVHYRLRLESLDGRGVPTRIRVDVVTPKAITEAALRNGASVPATVPGLAAAVVTRATPSVLELATRAGLSWCPRAGEACEEVPGALLGAPEPDVWLVADTGESRAANLRATRFSLLAEGRVVVPRGAEATVDVSNDAKGPIIVMASSPGGVPGVRMEASSLPPSSGGGPERGASPGDATTVSDNAALAVSLAPNAPKAAVFEGSGEGPLEVDLRRIAFAVPTVGAPGVLANGAAARMDLSGGASSTRLALGNGLVAVFSRGDTVVRVAWAADAALDTTVETTADRLTVLNPTKTAAPWSATVRSLGREPAAIADGRPFEHVSTDAGRYDVLVPAAPGRTLHLRGSVEGATLLRRDGRHAQGLDLPLDAQPATLSVDHGAGAWIAWIDGSDDEAKVLWGGPPPAPGAPVAVPAEVALDQPVVSIQVPVKEAGLLQVRAGQPVVAHVRQGERARVLLALDGALDLPVAGAETVEVALRAVGGGALRGAADVGFAPAVTLQEGLGAEAIVPAGASRAYAFTVPNDGPIGVGVRVDGATPTVRLVDAGGAVIGEGPAQMPTLKAGRYLLTVSVPPTGSARIRPAVVGLVPPDTGPPAEVIRSYLVAAGLLPPEATPAPDADDVEEEGE